MNPLYTIGYSSFTPLDFIHMLKQNNINALADVRTLPYSRYHNEYNAENLKNLLKKNNIFYVPLGKECGARPEDSNCYVDGCVVFEKLAQTQLFQIGLRRLMTGLQKYTIAIMCAEEDPITCHRYILVAHELAKLDNDISIINILPEGVLEDSTKSDKRLLHMFHLDHEELPGMGRNYQERLNDAYALQAKKIAYEKILQEE